MSRSRFTQLSIELAGAEIGGRHQEAAALRRALNGEGMSQYHDTNMKKAIGEIARWVGPAVNELNIVARDAAEAAERGTPVSASWVLNTRGKILERVRYGDDKARDAFKAAAEEALTDARKMRAAAEAGRDPRARIADEMERARLVASSTSAEDIAAQAKASLDAGQPRRAALLLAVALDKGAKFTGTMASDIEDAIDAAEPERRAARSIEESVAAYSQAFRDVRLQALTSAGLGVTPDGSVGDGQSSGVARSSIAAKMAAHRAGQSAPDGVLASAPKLASRGPERVERVPDPEHPGGYITRVTS